jgi:hypothetical protein
MEYFYTDGTTNFGPFTLEQLKEKNITPVTKIWYSGLSGWTAANEIPELAGILASSPPPVNPPPPPQPAPSASVNYMQGRPPKTWLVESILVTLFCCLPFGIAGIIYASRVESKFYAGDHSGAQQASIDAGKWTKIGFWIGLIVLVIYFGAIFFLAINGGDFEKFSPNY